MYKHVLLFNDSHFFNYKKLENVNDDCTICGLNDISEELEKDYSVFINTHGDFFPQEAVESLMNFLQNGKGFLNIGGVPLKNVPHADEESISGNTIEQMAYYRKLNIHSYMSENCDSVEDIRCSEDYSLLRDFAECIDEKNAKSMVWNATKDKYEPKIWGSNGSVDVSVHSLLDGIDKDRRVVSYASLVENWNGAFRGGRWILISGTVKSNCIDISLLADSIEFISDKCTRFLIEPGYASYFCGERPSVKISVYQYDAAKTWEGSIVCRNKDGIIDDLLIAFDGKEQMQSMYRAYEEIKEPGYYELKAELKSESGEKIRAIQGFYIYDDVVIGEKGHAEASHSYFRIGGKLSPVLGTTYMSDEVSRSFLLYPNAAHWRDDMRSIAAEGINWIRTGLWCNWRRYMWDSGRMDEAVLRAFDAFIQTAAEYGLHVTFTFFSFVPESWEGNNPYLDERSLKAQEIFIASFVSRSQNYRNIDWDLINEPYTFDHPLTKKSPDDVLEQKAFADYLRIKYENVNKMNELLDLDGTIIKDFSDVRVPLPEEINFEYTDNGDSKNGLIWREYKLFTIEVFRKWIQRMSSVIKAYCPEQMICVGQDEAIRGQRPTSLFFENDVDYTTQHPWWYNDSIVYSLKTSLSLMKPLLNQETGVMYVERGDGQPRIDEEETANLIEKKFAYSFAVGGAGAVHWVWNSNYDLKSAGEAYIGALRNDQTMKPESLLFSRFRSFFMEIGESCTDIICKPSIAVIYPFSNDLSNRSFAGIACRNLVHIFTDYLKYDFYFVNELVLDSLEEEKPKVIIAPSPHQFSDAQFIRLTDYISRNDTTVIFTGPVSINEYCRYSERLTKFGEGSGIRLLQRYENLIYDEKKYSFSYNNQMLNEAYVQEYSGQLCTKLHIGKGTLVLVGIPVDLSESIEESAELYKKLIDESGFIPEFEFNASFRESVYVSKIDWSQCRIYFLINESAQKSQCVLKDSGRKMRYLLDIEGNETVMFSVNPEGQLLNSYRGKKIVVEKEER